MGDMNFARSAAEGVLRHFTTDQAVRAGMITAAWSGAASLGRGLLPRTPVQQAAVSGAVVASHYMLGAFTWSSIASAAAGTPGHRAGSKALLAAAAVSAGGSKFLEVQLRPRSGDSLAWGSLWSAAKLVSVIGLAGGLVTSSDLIEHEVLGLRRSPGTTLALDLAAGGLMAGSTIIRRRSRAQRYRVTAEEADAVVEHGSPRNLAGRVKSATYVGGVAAGTSLGLIGLAVAEQATARQITRAMDSATKTDLGEFGVLLGHTVTAGAFVVASYQLLRSVRKRIERRAEVIEAAYPEPPEDPYVSCGPRSAVPFDAVGKEGRRFVTMRVPAREIEELMGEPAVEPVRVVVPLMGTPADRVRLAIEELRATGGLDRSLICVAAPTGVGYVNYVMAESLEYLARGDCAIVVPQYAYVPSALALDKTDEGTQVQREVIEAIVAAAPGKRVVQFGESLGAQVAADVGGTTGVPVFDEIGLDSGLYLGVPFRSSLWRAYLKNPSKLVAGGRLVVVADADELLPGTGRHVMINHHDDPINKFAYSMVVQRPWWMGPASSRPPLVPRETLYRPITTFMIGVVDILNGMNMKPGEFRRFGHDYRFDMRQAIQKTFDLPADAAQADRIESALREREQMWAERRLIAKTGERALQAVRDTINSWGRNSVNLQHQEVSGDETGGKLLEYLNARLSRKPGAGYSSSSTA